MNKKGFTLVELLAVLVVLALISLIAIPAVTKIINSAKSDVSDSQMKNIERVLDDYIAANADTLADGDEICIIDLKKEGLLTNKDIINSETGEKYDGCFYLSWNSQNNQFDYFYGNDSVVVTFDANGGTVDTNSKTVYVGSKYGTLPIPTREGYTFKGWNGKNLLNEEATFMNIKDATYVDNHYMFTFNNAHKKYGGSTSSGLPITGFKENTRYTITVNGYSSRNDGNPRFVIVYTDGSDVTRKSINTTEEKTITYTSNAGKTIDGIYFTYGYGGNLYISSMQIEEGSTATPYEPYYITKDTTVVQTGNHTLTAIWEAN